MRSLIDTYPSHLFSYDASKKQFTSEASTLGKGMPSSNMIAIKSRVTGNTKSFRLVNVSRDRENDIQYWKYSISATDATMTPSLKGLTVVIFND